MLHVWLTRLFHLNESILVKAGLLQRHFPSQDKNLAEKSLAGDGITPEKTHLTFNVHLGDLTAYHMQSLRLFAIKNSGL